MATTAASMKAIPFSFSGDNSGLYGMYIRGRNVSIYWDKRANTLRSAAGAPSPDECGFVFETQYGHMIPDELPWDEVVELVGDERERMRLSTGYTINRSAPTRTMAVKILREYQRRRDAKAGEFCRMVDYGPAIR